MGLNLKFKPTLEPRETNMNRLRHVTILLAGILASSSFLMSAGISRADDVKPPEKKGWESVASAGLTLTRGNSENFLANVSINSTRKWTDDELLLGASAGYGKTKDRSNGTTTKTDDYIKAFAQWNHLFTPKIYGGLRFDIVHDDVADLDYRFTVSPLVGYYFFRKPNTSLSAEAGPAFIYEKQGGEDAHGYFAARLGEKYEYTFVNKAKVWETFEFLPQVDDVENYIINVEVGVSAPITKSLDVRLTAFDTYDNRPAAGRLPNDLKLMAGIGFKF
jgi:putative salt-induced outer membrane protein YdiY